MTEEQLRWRAVETALAWEGAVRGGAVHRAIIDTYNSYRPLPRGYRMTDKDPWCAAMVSAVAIRCGLTAIMPVECSCGELVRLYQALGRWVEEDGYVPRMGDVILYHWKDGEDYADTDQQGAPNHVGLVTAVEGDTIRVMEGNMGSKSVVGCREVKVNGRYIRGYGCPDYGALADRPWYQTEWDWATERGLFDGTRPEEPITRAEAATVLYRLELGKGKEE